MLALKSFFEEYFLKTAGYFIASLLRKSIRMSAQGFKSAEEYPPE